MKPKFTPSITREEFEALACRKPGLDGDWLYRYEAYSVRDDNEKSPLYPKFNLWKENSRLFRSFEDAEAFLHSNEPSIPDYKFYCHYIYQIPVGEWDDLAGSCWMYDGEKNLIDYSLPQWTAKAPEDYHFFGRPENRQRFSPGEIVEVICGSEVQLALLVQPSPDVEWCWQYLQRCKSRCPDDPMPYTLDPTDDACYILNGPGDYYHDHIPPTCIMKTHLPVPDDIRATMESWGELVDKPIDNQSTYATSDRLPIGGLDISVCLSENPEIPHLHIVDGYALKVGLRIDKPEYYDHDEYCDSLSESQVIALMTYLSHTKACRTNWWYLLRNWNDDEFQDGYSLPLDTPLPDYWQLLDQI